MHDVASGYGVVRLAPAFCRVQLGVGFDETILAAPRGVVERGAVKAGTRKTGVAKVCAVEPGAGKIAAGKIGVAEIGPMRRDVLQRAVPETAAAERGALDAGVVPDGLVEGAVAAIRIAQIRADELRQCGLNRDQPDAAHRGVAKVALDQRAAGEIGFVEFRLGELAVDETLPRVVPSTQVALLKHRFFETARRNGAVAQVELEQGCQRNGAVGKTEIVECGGREHAPVDFAICERTAFEEAIEKMDRIQATCPKFAVAEFALAEAAITLSGRGKPAILQIAMIELDLPDLRSGQRRALYPAFVKNDLAQVAGAEPDIDDRAFQEQRTREINAIEVEAGKVEVFERLAGLDFLLERMDVDHEAILRSVGTVFICVV
nr:hypothetical protein [Paraburkholderia lycopersici]